MITKPAEPAPRPLPLQPGDHLTVEEFHRRYLAMSESVKAELIDGVVYMMPQTRTRSVSPSSSQAKSAIPRLQFGDHLTAAEFEQRYRAMPDLKKAELIDGVVFMPSPVSCNNHGLPHLAMATWLGH